MKRFSYLSWVLLGTLALGLGLGACANAEGTPEASESTELDLSINPSLEWYGNTRQYLDQFIKEYRVGGEKYDPEGYVVFDWDNTVIYNDIENCFVAYMALTGHVKRPAGNDWKLMSAYVSPDLEAALDSRCGGTEDTLPTDDACIDTVFRAYYDGEVLKDDETLADAFTVGNSKVLQPAYLWGGQVGHGWSHPQLLAFSKATADWCLALGLEEEVPVGFDTYHLAIRFYEEIFDLMVSLEEAGITQIISTASPEYLVEAAAKKLPITPAAVLGVKLEQENGVYTGRTVAMGDYASNQMINYQLGKVIEALEYFEGVDTTGMTDEEIINGTHILLGLGDSDTDVQFLKAASAGAHAWNRQKTGLMCPMYHWMENGDPDRPGKFHAISPLPINPKDQKEGGYTCNVEDLPAGLGITSIDANIVDSVYWP
ncbi:MAG: hypothetical protein KDK66_01780 [Deltaproteobacteria bacterium]|nr:hypothetical protein [Deltaproteobacteria bacterium]